MPEAVSATGEISLLCLRVAYPWMGRHSGYDAFYHTLEAMDAPLRLSSVTLGANDPGFLKRRMLNRFYWQTRASDQYTYRHGEAEARLRHKARRESPDVLFYLAGDESIGLVGRTPEDFAAPVVATLHQPPAWWKLRHRRHDYLQAIARILVVSTGQSDFVEEVTGRRPVFIPHGVDTEFYHPDTSRKDEQPSFLFVGQWLRDFEALNAIIERVLEQNRDACFHLVVPEWRRSESILLRIGRHKNCRFYAGLSDEELLRLYQSATALAMPVIDATANNAIIEAAAAGLPIVATNCTGIRDYTREEFAFLVERNDPDEFASRLLQIAGDPRLATSMQAAARDFACSQLDWKVVAPQLVQLLAELHTQEK